MRITTKHQNDRSDGGLQFILATISSFAHRDDGLYSFYMLSLFYSTIQLTNDAACASTQLNHTACADIIIAGIQRSKYNSFAHGEASSRYSICRGC